MTTAINWQKSSFSEAQVNCIEPAPRDRSIVVRESDDPNVIVTTSRAKLAALIQGIKAGEFDRLI